MLGHRGRHLAVFPTLVIGLLHAKLGRAFPVVSARLTIGVAAPVVQNVFPGPLPAATFLAAMPTTEKKCYN